MEANRPHSCLPFFVDGTGPRLCRGNSGRRPRALPQSMDSQSARMRRRGGAHRPGPTRRSARALRAMPEDSSELLWSALTAGRVFIWPGYHGNMADRSAAILVPCIGIYGTALVTGPMESVAPADAAERDTVYPHPAGYRKVEQMWARGLIAKRGAKRGYLPLHYSLKLRRMREAEDLSRPSASKVEQEFQSAMNCCTTGQSRHPNTVGSSSPLTSAHALDDTVQQ